MICRNCGIEIADKALICYKCGVATVEAKHKGPEGEGLGLRVKPQRRGKTVVIAVLVLALLVLLLYFLLNSASL
jgi:uncharacterized membrane protein YvbJ